MRPLERSPQSTPLVQLSDGPGRSMPTSTRSVGPRGASMPAVKPDSTVRATSRSPSPTLTPACSSDCSISAWSRSPAPMICPSRKHAVESAVADPGSRLMEPAQLAVHGRTGPRVTVLDEGCGLALFAMLGLGSLEHLAEPVRRRSDTAAARRDGVPATARVQARWGDDVPAVAADVDAGTEPAARVVQHGEAGVGEVEVPSSGAGADGTAGLQRTMVPQHRVEAVVAAVIGIDVDDDESTRGAGPDGDVGAWPAAPPPPDHRRS